MSNIIFLQVAIWLYWGLTKESPVDHFGVFHVASVVLISTIADLARVISWFVKAQNEQEKIDG